MRSVVLGGTLMLAVACAARDRADDAAGHEQGTPGGNFIVAEEPPPPPSGAELGKCLIQDGKQLRAPKVRAIGTEPFWSAEVEGRCILYKTPEDQVGTRFWTQVGHRSSETVWTGSGSRQFQLTVKPSPQCSDGMSDKTYPMEAQLRVNGETRKGCAESL